MNQNSLEAVTFFCKRVVISGKVTVSLPVGVRYSLMVPGQGESGMTRVSVRVRLEEKEARVLALALTLALFSACLR